MKYLLNLLLFCSVFVLHGQNNTVGLLHSEEASYNGYTLFSPSAGTKTFLVDNCGRLVHEWTGTSRPGRTAVLREDGLLLRCEQLGTENAQWGGGSGGKLLLIDWDDNIVWQYAYSAENYFQHHEAAMMPNGNVLIFAWDRRVFEDAIDNGRDPALVDEYLWSEKVVELRPVGVDSAEVVWEWYLWDHLVQDFDPTKGNFGNVSEHPELVDLNFIDVEGAGPGAGGNAMADWIHLNSIDYNADLDQIVLSSRNFSEVWVLDHSTTTEEAAGHTGGNAGKGGDILYRWGNPQTYKSGGEGDRQFYRQHNSRWIRNAITGAHELSVFNNGLFREPVEYSSVDILDLPVEGFEYAYTEAEAYMPESSKVFYGNGTDQFIFSLRVSSAQLLPNGNFLIDLGIPGRFIEVDEEGNVVWEYLNPVGAQGPYDQGEMPFGNSVFNVSRYGVDYSGFEGQILDIDGFVEGNPSPTGCQIFPEVDMGFFDKPEIAGSLTLDLYPVPCAETLTITLNDATPHSLRIVDINGRLMLHSDIQEVKQLELADLLSGVYFVLIDNQAAGSFVKY